jgi:hypothetical protein
LFLSFQHEKLKLQGDAIEALKSIAFSFPVYKAKHFRF